jgi:putative ABC transport system permease protein
VSVFILLLAAVNFINLTIASAVSRSKEVRLRKLQGASRMRLAGQFMAEVVFLVFLSVCLSFLLLWYLNPLVHSLTGFSFNASGFVSGQNLVVLLLGFLVFTVVAGIYPSLHLSSGGSNSGIPSHGHYKVRNGLIVFQNLVSITLICCTLVANSQFRYMSRKDLGFNKENVIILKLNSELKKRIDLFRQSVQQIPGISSITFSSRIPGNYWGSWCCVKVEGKENKYFNNYVDPFYLKTLGITLKEGRNFSENEGDIKTTYLINETAIKTYDLKNPVGQIITPGNGIKGEIIGIIKDFHYRGLQYEQTPLLLFNTPEYKNYVNIKISGADIEGTIQKIRKIWEETCPAFVFNYSFLDSTYDLQYSSERKFESLLFSFALLALFIAAIGLLGISVFTTERRTKEIGIRKVNGANSIEIIRMLLKDIIPWIMIAFLISCPLVWYIMTGWLKNFAFRTNINPWIFVFSALISFGVAAITITLQSWKAASKNPVETLRYE